jgi:hypothetical protein
MAQPHEAASIASCFPTTTISDFPMMSSNYSPPSSHSWTSTSDNLADKFIRERFAVLATESSPPPTPSVTPPAPTRDVRSSPVQFLALFGCNHDCNQLLHRQKLLTIDHNHSQPVVNSCVLVPTSSNWLEPSILFIYLFIFYNELLTPSVLHRV